MARRSERPQSNMSKRHQLKQQTIPALEFGTANTEEEDPLRLDLKPSSLCQVNQPAKSLFLNMFQCNECRIVFPNVIALISHNSMLHNNINIQDTDIKNTNKQVAIHMDSSQKNHTEVLKKLYDCKLCNEIFGSSSQLEAHIRSHTVEKPFACSHCNKRYASNSQLIEHKRFHTAEKRFVCNYCEKIFHQRSNLIIHLRMHADEKPYACTPCYKRFVQKFPLLAHMLCTVSEPNACKFCGVKLNVQNKLVNPLRSHAEKLLACDHCDEKFVNKYQLTSHMAIHAESRTSDINKTVSNADITQHMELHTEERPYSCELCDSNFTNEASYQAHIKKHIMGRPVFKCNRCEKTYSDYSSLKKHSKEHTDEPDNLACIYCNKLFLEKQSLKSHMLVHTSERIYACTVCDKSYFKKTALLRHNRLSHVREKPLKCDQCPKAFVQKCDLVKHYRRHTGERPYQCPQCDHSASQKGDLKRHIKSIHSDEVIFYRFIY